MSVCFSIIITTYNRIEALKTSFSLLENLFERDDTEFIVCDDGSTDGTYDFVSNHYPKIKLIRNDNQNGLIYSRNRLMNMVDGLIAISLDDDLNFLSEQPLEIIKLFFDEHPQCAVQSFRIYWGLDLPPKQKTKQMPHIVNSFAGGAHAFRMNAWNAIPNYPAWFRFYGEENYISYFLFKQDWQVFYQPHVFTHHRVSLKERKFNKDYIIRQKRSLRSGWFLYVLFFPKANIPRFLVYSFFIYLKKSIISLNLKSMVALFLATLDFLIFLPKLIINRNALSREEFKKYQNLTSVPLYWKPKNEEYK